MFVECAEIGGVEGALALCPLQAFFSCTAVSESPSPALCRSAAGFTAFWRRWRHNNSLTLPMRRIRPGSSMLTSTRGSRGVVGVACICVPHIQHRVRDQGCIWFTEATSLWCSECTSGKGAQEVFKVGDDLMSNELLHRNIELPSGALSIPIMDGVVALLKGMPLVPALCTRFLDATWWTRLCLSSTAEIETIARADFESGLYAGVARVFCIVFVRAHFELLVVHSTTGAFELFDSNPVPIHPAEADLLKMRCYMAIVFPGAASLVRY